MSKLHGDVSKRMFAPVWEGFFPEESHVSYVTNGVHLPTWAAPEWQQFFVRHFGADYPVSYTHLDVIGKARS